LDLGGTNNLTLARYQDDLEYIKIWTTIPRRLIFWDGARNLSR